MRKQIDELTMKIGICVLERSDSGAQIIMKNGKTFSITLPESCLLERMATEQGKVISKHDLIVSAWGRPETIGSNSLPVAITNLRKILEFSNTKIVNVPRKGYKIEIPEDAVKEHDSPILTDSINIEKTDKIENIKPTFSYTLKIYASFISLLLIGYSLLYITFSWVHVDCIEIGKASVCSLRNENPDLTNIKASNGNFYYSHKSGLIEFSNDN
ncbi:hypothetical protein VTH8203_03940 [Vibrio thalassae]|uniref:OmpR/PhoB-type domain-containing protein n=1 Tax=Vibrio thalassae TaxID=1243014 RepID=A0A240EQI5_9VIBR|nr:winged helix-turn-helix domain-containing protein [Vibrio thalassae]SNX50285.1 hypothetical protein VTH8203_03940 [Vibrio thalassae]